METLDRCPGCGGAEWTAVTRRGLDFAGEEVQACRACGLFFLSPRLDPAELESYYASEFSARFRGAERPDAAALAWRDRLAAYRFEVLRRAGALAPGRTLLELGCGAGNFLEPCRRLGMEVWGVEPSVGYAEVARERGHRVEIGHFPEVRGALDRYDVVALFHVLEHLPDPVAALGEIRRLLGPESFLAVEVPDLARSFGPRWSARYFARPHLIDFTADSLRFVLARAGYSVVLEDTPRGDRRRRHHLLAVARPDPAAAAPSPDPARTARLIRRVRRRLLLAAAVRPVYAGVRRLAGRRGRAGVNGRGAA